MELGNYIYGDILENGYLKLLYKKLIHLYFENVIKVDSKESLSTKEKIDLLRFADILSKSTEDSKRDTHNNIAQSIISMMNKLYFGDELVQYVNGSVLTNVNNYLGLDKNFSGYYNRDVMEFIKEEVQRDSYYIPNTDKSYFINTQKLAYERIKMNDYYSFSAPTSMGKTFLIRTYIKESVLAGKQKNFAVVVPSKALINEVSNSIIDDLNENLVKYKYKVIQTPTAIIEKENCNYIMVYTQERLLQFLTMFNGIKLSHVFIDEAHKISDMDERSPFFYKCIDILEKYHFGVKINFSCPNIPNPEVYLRTIKSEGNKAYNRFRYSPVNQLKTIIDITHNVCYIYNDLEKEFKELENRRTDFTGLVQLVKIIGEGKSNIVFCNSRKDATQWAIDYCNAIDTDFSNEQEMVELIKSIKEDIHDKCYLTQTLLKGVAYHVAYLPAQIKEKIENLYRKGIIKTIFCTSTLLEGVNFPADNLFIKLGSKDSWLKAKQRASFKNLIGRVGRIDFNLFGNVFCISEDANKEYKEAISEDVDMQELSLDTLTDNRKKDIVQTLLQGKTSLQKRSVDTYDSLSFARKTLNILLNEIVEDTPGVVSEAFQKFLDEETIDKIKSLFKCRQNNIPKDLLATCDEMERLDYAIKVLKLHYPETINYGNVVSFLSNLSEIFNWDKYESGLDIGNKNRLKYYAVIIIQWMFGNTIKEIIAKAIEYHKQNGIYYPYKKPNLQEYTGSSAQINKIINDVLDEVDKILQFKIPNYFSKFSERYKELNNIEYIQNDWHDYIEYGTINHIAIRCQQLGLSRECSLYIYKNRCFDVINGLIKIKTNLLKDSKFDQEIKRLKLNYPDFIKIS